MNFKPALEIPATMPSSVSAASPERLKIGALAARTDTTTPTIRFYEEIGLLPAADRQSGGQRQYGEEDVRRLTFIRRCREFGFSVEQVRELVALIQDSARSCTDAREIAHTHLNAVRAKLTELRALEREMARFVERCDTECAGGPGHSCTPLAELAYRDGASASAPVRKPRSGVRRPHGTESGRARRNA